ncbi:MAG: hypothetical protein Q7Q71_09955 [Verrucomicrobiota bacterium JB023]|nr:hypothetical protein [Verrucomicrobiota bacterium JB023]
MRTISASLAFLAMFTSQLFCQDRHLSERLPMDCSFYFDLHCDEPGEFWNELMDSLLVEKEFIMRDLVDEELRNELDELKEQYGEDLPLPTGSSEVKDLSDLGEFLGGDFVFAVGGEGSEFLSKTGPLYHEVMSILARLITIGQLSALTGLKEDGVPADYMDMMGRMFSSQLIDEQLIEELIVSLSRGGKLALPSIYLGFKPGDADKVFDELNNHGEELLADEELAVERVVLDGVRVPVNGVRLKGDGNSTDDLWPTDEERPDFIDEEVIEDLKEAIDTLELTVVWAKVDGWIVLWMGNGEENFKLVEGGMPSLAGDGQLNQISALAETSRMRARFRVSKDILECLPEWLNDSPEWRARASQISLHQNFGAKNELRDLAYEMAKYSTLLSKRDVESDWYGTAWLDEGFRLETIGGMRVPWLDYDTEWTMEAATAKMPYFLRAHWMRSSHYRGWQWQRNVTLWKMLDAALAEFLSNDEEMALNASYRNLLRQPLDNLVTASHEMAMEGLGDEVGLIVDLEGRIPPVEEVPPEVANGGRIPRFLGFQSVADRQVVAEQGGRMLSEFKNLWKLTEGANPLPFPGVISGEIEQLEVNFFTSPYFDEDFIPITGLGEELYCYGSSRRLLEQLARAPRTDTGNGLLIEANLAKMGQFLRQWDELAGGDFEAEEDQPISEEDVWAFIERFGSFRYHHRMEDGELRSSLQLEFADDE